MKKVGGILIVFLIAVMFVNVFPSSASAASNTFTEKYGSGNVKTFSVQQNNGLILKLYTYYKVDANGVTITSVSPKTVDVAWPYSVETDKPKILVASTKGTKQSAVAYGDFRTYILKAWKFGQAYQTTDRLTMSFKATKIDTKKKTVTFTVKGTAEK